MADPYKIIGVPQGADQGALRQRYLELVRQYPPEKCPQQFAEIREAYDDLRNPEARVYRLIFNSDTGESLDEIIADVRGHVQSTRIPTETLLFIAEG